MKIIILIVAALIPLPLSAQVTFTDNFDRPNSAAVGNGWSDVTGQAGTSFWLDGATVGTMSILNNQATYTAGSGVAGIYRPFNFPLPISVTATLYEMNGFGSLTSRFNHAFAIRSDGTIGNGYGLSFARSDELNFVSDIRLFDGSTSLGLVQSSFQFTSAIAVQATFNLDGSVNGTVSEGLNSYNFAFGAQTIASSGANFIYGTSGTSGPLDSRLDNLTVSTPAPEPSAALLLGGAGLGLLLRRRARPGTGHPLSRTPPPRRGA